MITTISFSEVYKRDGNNMVSGWQYFSYIIKYFKSAWRMKSYRLLEMIVEPSSLKNPFGNQRLIISYRVVHFEINIKDNTDRVIPHRLPSSKYQNELVVLIERKGSSVRVIS